MEILGRKTRFLAVAANNRWIARCSSGGVYLPGIVGAATHA
jgi:hypothetical protein